MQLHSFYAIPGAIKSGGIGNHQPKKRVTQNLPKKWITLKLGNKGRTPIKIFYHKLI
jgi:hypothetical protein